MNKLHLTSVLFSLSIPFCVFAQENIDANFCSILSDKLLDSYLDGMITRNLSFNYSAIGSINHNQMSVYELDTNYDPHSRKNQLSKCYFSSTNYASLTLNRKLPIILTEQKGQQNENPVFNIEFSKNNNTWTATSVSSHNCVNLLSSSIIHIYKKYFKIRNIEVDPTFYDNLHQQTINEACPAHYNDLRSLFNNQLKGI